ncbi:MAG: hypothetical protein ACREPW_11120, partial [Candidatus Binataceae bacterium]
MQPVFLSMQAIAARLGEGLRPELKCLLEQANGYRIRGIENAEPVIAPRSASETAPSTGLDDLNVEVVGPSSLLPDGHKCRLHFNASGAATIMIGMRN